MEGKSSFSVEDKSFLDNNSLVEVLSIPDEDNYLMDLVSDNEDDNLTEDVNDECGDVNDESAAGDVESKDVNDESGLYNETRDEGLFDEFDLSDPKMDKKICEVYGEDSMYRVLKVRTN